HIHFAADAKLRQINPRFDRKTRVRNDSAIVARFEAVHVRTIAVNFAPDAMAGAMHESLGIACLGDRVSGRRLDLPTMNRAAVHDCLSNEFDSAIPRVPHDPKNLGILGRHALAEISYPGDVIIDICGTTELRPDVE